MAGERKGKKYKKGLELERFILDCLFHQQSYDKKNPKTLASFGFSINKEDLKRRGRTYAELKDSIKQATGLKCSKKSKSIQKHLREMKERGILLYDPETGEYYTPKVNLSYIKKIDSIYNIFPDYLADEEPWNVSDGMALNLNGILKLQTLDVLLSPKDKKALREYLKQKTKPALVKYLDKAASKERKIKNIREATIGNVEWFHHRILSNYISLHTQCLASKNMTEVRKLANKSSQDLMDTYLEFIMSMDRIANKTHTLLNQPSLSKSDKKTLISLRPVVGNQIPYLEDIHEHLSQRCNKCIDELVNTHLHKRKKFQENPFEYLSSLVEIPKNKKEGGVN